MTEELNVLVVGQTPPPYHGSAVMTQKLLEGRYPGVRLYHVSMALSRDIDEVGHFKSSKVFKLVGLIARIVVARLRTGATVLYYLPGGPHRLPMFRDLVLLVATRWMFRRTIFHFHAGGLSDLYPRLGPGTKWLFRRAYSRPDVAIRVDPLAPEDGSALGAKIEIIIPNGVEDTRIGLAAIHARAEQSSPPIILYVGVLRESKGILVLLEACAEIAHRGTNFELQLMGMYGSDDFRTRVSRKIEDSGLSSRIRHLGVLTGQEKALAYHAARMVCLPTFYESETFGLVLVEAMSYGLPVVATDWRGIPSLVSDDQNGFLVPARDSRALANRLETLLNDSDRACTLGSRGRAVYEERYRVELFHERTGRMFDMVRMLEAGDQPRVPSAPR